MKTYLGAPTPGREPAVVFVDSAGEGHMLPLGTGKYRFADRFAWGPAGGQESSQLAFAILLDHFQGNISQAKHWCHSFKWKVLIEIPEYHAWELTTKQIDLALYEIREELQSGKAHAGYQ